MADLKDVYNEWLTNLAFREQFKKDPIKACQDANLTISASDLEKISSMLELLEKLDNDELDKRISK